MKAFLKTFFHDQSGATALEYGAIAALISVVIIVAVTSIGAKTNGAFSALANALP